MRMMVLYPIVVFTVPLKISDVCFSLNLDPVIYFSPTLYTMKVIRKGDKAVMTRNKKRGLNLRIRTTDSLDSVCNYCCFYNNPDCNEKGKESPCEMLRLRGKEHFVIDHVVETN